jgi:hypothetical protein
MKKISIVLSILVASQIALAAKKPNLYRCKGGDIEITYSTTGFDGRARLNVTNYSRDSNTAQIAVAGDSIKSQKTILGTIISAMVSAVPDYKTEYGSLVLPRVNLSETGSNAADVDFTTTYFETTKKTSIAGPDYVTGVVEESKAYEVTCTASLVYF